MAGIGLRALALGAVIAGTMASRVSLKGIRLTKGGHRQEYMNLGADDLSYQLECLVDAQPSDIVNITWSLSGYGDVYTWSAATGHVTVHEPLKEHVRTPVLGVDVGPDIEFVTPTPSVRGLYTCSLYHARPDAASNPLTDTYNLLMYAFFQEAFNMTVSLKGCSLLWNFSTPRMYPRPEVRCGFRNSSSGLLASQLPGGLVYHQNIDLTWQVFAHDYPLQVSDIPRGTTFQCNTLVPIANYSRQTELDMTSTSSQRLYNEVEDRGCPTLPPLQEHMEVVARGCWPNCRDECHHVEGSVVEVEYRCDPGYVAKWELDGREMPRWRLKIKCDEADRYWTPLGGSPIKSLRLPYCLRSGATKASSRVSLLAIAFLVGLLPPWTMTR